MSSDLHEALHDLAEKFETFPIDAQGLISRHTRRKRTTAIAWGGFAVVVTSCVGLLISTGGQGARDTLQPAATSSATPLTVATPRPSSGRAWLIDAPPPRRADGSLYDPADGQPTPSPKPREDKALALLALQHAYDAAGLPKGSTLTPHPDGYGTATDDIALPGGTKLLLIRDRFDHPINFRMSSADGVGAEILLQDVPGTTAAALIDNNCPYADSPDGGGGHGVTVVAADGTTINWVAPSTFNLTTLRDWAFAGARGTVN